MRESRVHHPPVPRRLVVALGAAVALGAVLAGAPAARAAGDWARHEVIVGVRGRPAVTRPRPDAAVPGGGAGVRSTVVHLRAGESVPAALRRLRRRSDVAYAEPDYIAHAAGAFYPDDPGRSGRRGGWTQQQWNLLPGSGIDAPLAWSNLLAVHRPGGRGVRIAVLDTGVAYRSWRQYRVSPDLRRTRFVDPWDFVAGDGHPLDRNGHGTFVASVLAEGTNNGIGLAGLAYGATIMPVRVLDANGLGDESTIAAGIRYAVAHHAQIINLSLEFPPVQVRSASAIPEIVSAIADARRHGVMVVAAAGNDETSRIAYPARVRGVVSVGATTEDGCLANYSNLGHDLDLVAPGGGSDAILPDDSACHPARVLPPIHALTLDDPPHWSSFGYPNYYIGTSMSAPEVAATAALVMASGVIGPHPTADQVLAHLEQTATPLPAAGPRPNRTYGYGLLDAGAATSPPPAAARAERAAAAALAGRAAGLR
jgi:serine protease